ncbi:enoyl-CoA delta isomerase 1, mitochondrial-like [Odontomachus brunneus]|uniref:enoyl-CoA delta isomerase 1, mitochondrial-like n=1 Tax=Odontomachus brunneus TaxID=486640 RepID=UPI0013F2A728|nr:enoyl-CoA delta isomerase 1, mitochondrial-like [Odontomachus brunneus]XP_032677228.1 enoyl-CoA delta isomerase 1, mitochondrial-like [Odontomachus brunneus]XP_032677229.1 enoyl-CoA delta isomerase 1, mitochondrial-like [Odontomachus brunneus]
MNILRTIVARRVCLKRFYTTDMQLIKTTRDNNTGIDVISLANAPVNVWDVQMCNELKTSLLNARNNGSKGIILTSSLNVFSAGGDLKMGYDINKRKFIAEFWRSLQDAWLTLYSIEIPIATAINGSSYGVGCLMAISTEYRVFVKGQHKIGITDTRVGLYVPKWFQHPFISLTGYRQAEIALLRSSTFKPEEALKIGLVNELAVDKADAIEKCKNYILSYDDISTISRKVTKLDLRGKIIQWLEENREADIEKLVKYLMLPEVQDNCKRHIESLKRKE